MHEVEANTCSLLQMDLQGWQGTSRIPIPKAQDVLKSGCRIVLKSLRRNFLMLLKFIFVICSRKRESE